MEDLGTVPDVKIITAAIADDDPEAWHTYILFYHHSLYFPTMQRHLLNPNQMRANDVIVNETPLVLLPALSTMLSSMWFVRGSTKGAH